MTAAHATAYADTLVNFLCDPDRVRRHTSEDINARIDEEIRLSIEFHAHQRNEVISARIATLEREWDIERVLEVNASSLALTGVVMAAVTSKKWLALPIGVLGMLLLHATRGWCPPLPALRRSGVRTQSEIEREKFALKFLRGDFSHVVEDNARTEPAQLAEALLQAG